MAEESTFPQSPFCLSDWIESWSSQAGIADATKTVVIITIGIKLDLQQLAPHVKIQRVLGEAVAGCVGGAAAFMTYAVRAPSSSVFGPSVYHGCTARRAISLTFDDGPSERTEEILSVLEQYKIRSTFFQCGANVRRLPVVATFVVRNGHEIGNHTDSHPNFSFQSRKTISGEFRRAQTTIEDVLGLSPSLMRAPFGVRWFGFRQAQEELQLLGVMWTVIGNDWKLSPGAIATRLLRGARNGAIFCLHDGYELEHCSKTSATAEALRIAIPELLESGYCFETVNRILCPKN